MQESEGEKVKKAFEEGVEKVRKEKQKEKILNELKEKVELMKICEECKIDYIEPD